MDHCIKLTQKWWITGLINVDVLHIILQQMAVQVQVIWGNAAGLFNVGVTANTDTVMTTTMKRDYLMALLYYVLEITVIIIINIILLLFFTERNRRQIKLPFSPSSLNSLCPQRKRNELIFYVRANNIMTLYKVTKTACVAK